MQILVDGSRVDEAKVTSGTIREALLQLQTDLCPPGCMVVGLRCDDRDIPGDEMEATLGKPTSSFETLEVLTSTRTAVVADAMTQASVSLQETESACQRVAELLTEGQTAEAIEMLRECLRIWQQIHQAVGQSIEMLMLDAEQTMVQDDSLVELIARPKHILLQIKQALKAQDHVLLADILQYEFSEVIDHWHLVIARLREEAEEKEGPVAGGAT